MDTLLFDKLSEKMDNAQSELEMVAKEMFDDRMRGGVKEHTPAELETVRGHLQRIRFFCSVIELHCS